MQHGALVMVMYTLETSDPFILNFLNFVLLWGPAVENGSVK